MEEKVAETDRLKQEGITLTERIKALLTGQRIDRVPVWLWLMSSSFAARNVGDSIASSNNDPEKSFWAQLRTIQMYGSDDVTRFFTAGAWDSTWAFGGEIKWPNGEYAQAASGIRFPAESEDDAWRLKLPQDVKTAGAIPLHMQFSRLQERFGLPIWLFFVSPLEAAAGMCGVDTLLRWLAKNPKLVRRLLQLGMDYSVEVVRYWVSTFGPESIIAMSGAPMASNQVISPKYFETFLLPYQKELHEKILGMGIKHIFCHICGDQNLNLPYWTQVPMGNLGIVSFGHEVDLTTAVKYFGDTCIVAGNVEPAVIHAGTHEQVYRLAREAIEKAKDAPRGFILMPGCGISPLTPPYNVFMLKKATNDLGWYH